MKERCIKVFTSSKFWCLFLTPVAFLLLTLVKIFPWFAEYIYARGMYRFFATIISFITGLCPLSLGELLVVVFPIAVILFLVISTIHLHKKSYTWGKAILRTFINSACIASVIFFSYTLLCGLNYHRYSIAYYEDFTVKPSSVDELYELCETLSVKANELRAQIDTLDDAGVFQCQYTDYELSKRARKAFINLSKDYDVFYPLVTKPKPILLSKALSYTEITGIFFPFTVEANVNVDIRDFAIPVTMCHELAHLYGFMREDEANYIAYLACMASDDIEFQYSGTMLAFSYVRNQLYTYDKERYMEIVGIMGDGVRADYDAESEYWSQFQNDTISTISNKINDTYLKANEQTDGVNSYGRMIDLLLAKQRKDKEQ